MSIFLFAENIVHQRSQSRAPSRYLRSGAKTSGYATEKSYSKYAHSFGEAKEYMSRSLAGRPHLHSMRVERRFSWSGNTYCSHSKFR